MNKVEITTRKPEDVEYANEMAKEISKLPKRVKSTAQCASTQWLMDNPTATFVMGDNWAADKYAMRDTPL